MDKLKTKVRNKDPSNIDKITKKLEKINEKNPMMVKSYALERILLKNEAAAEKFIDFIEYCIYLLNKNKISKQDFAYIAGYYYRLYGLKYEGISKYLSKNDIDETKVRAQIKYRFTV